ncbi:hypothetical protein E1091_00340 [Micromonospora fluostatini]|uniref:Uncharacterized protein n=1 Tax=Micromonospora fluostatini TaxID=1629071 RepID=A0ABY2DM54_9ACTN|nr:hypothetical protein E1091_00340 [Micromonospora fluostatini]
MPDPLWINAFEGAPAYNAAELRQAMALALTYDGRLLGGRAGVRPGGNAMRVSLSGATLTVQPGVACVDPGLSSPQGPYWVALPVAETHALAAAVPGAARRDSVVLRVYDHDEDASGLRLARSEYLQGVPGSGVEPPLPAGCNLLSTIDVPALGGGSAVVSDRRFYTAAAGGIVPVTAAGDYLPGSAGRYRDRLDTGDLERDNGSAWETVASPGAYSDWTQVTPPTLTWTAATTNPVLGNGAATLRHKKVGRTVNVQLKLFCGTGTTFGAGAWQLGGWPAQLDRSQSDIVLYGAAIDASQNAPYPITAQLTTSGSVAVPRMGGHSATGAFGLVSATHPFTWASGDVLTLSGTYQSAA